MKTSTILGILVLFASHAAWADDCYPYMPDKVSIQGRLSMETLPAGEDKTDTFFFMNLPVPVCLAPAEEDDLNKPVPGVSKIQLSFREEAPAMNQKLQSYMDGETVKCSGSFFSWHTDRHHTPILMFTKECDPVAPATAALTPYVVN